MSDRKTTRRVTPGFRKQMELFRNLVKTRMEFRVWPAYTGTGEVVLVKLTTAMLAARADTSAQTVRNWLEGWTVFPAAETVWKIMNAVGLPFSVPTDRLVETYMADFANSQAVYLRITDIMLARLQKQRAVLATKQVVPEGRRYRKGSYVAAAK